MFKVSFYSNGVFSLFLLASSIIFLVTLLFSVAFYVLAERKILGSLQRRRGPSAVGFWGLAQPVADGVKLILKELIVPGFSSIAVYFLAPLVLLVLAFTC